ncbi:Alpha/Beta hydrolase protein [Phialemonium atrogriseum]|uniref:Alpha/Beta hydrolase protein n=1 Tax=Phialemonium atrogriseum TaxID=1093897 RepID=A0AAJ0C386_9PEZI|nr:Alpha/Beta hydrolase protein [Phialemonium atrogriseum]KAK1767887.1 Alpha/Beta hydrolase protein [Phialemonium atrogriseum]
MARPELDPTSVPPPFVVDPTSAHTHSLILLHGVGSNGEKFGRELLDTGATSDGLTLTQFLPNARFIFPTSRRHRSTAFGRSVLTQWFDIARLSDSSHRKELQLQGLAESARDILELLRPEQEMSKIPRANIVLGGLSQGCATSLSVLLCLDYCIGGFVGISGFLPFRDDIDEAVEEAVVDEDDPFSGGDDGEHQDPAKPDRESTAQSTPIFLGHGSADEKVPCSLGEAMAATLEKADYKVELKVCHGLGHWYKMPDEIDDIVEFLRSVVGWKVLSGDREIDSDYKGPSSTI